jgi:hypothetical protein
MKALYLSLGVFPTSTRVARAGVMDCFEKERVGYETTTLWS